MSEADTAARRSFWTEYQPGLRFSAAEVGSPEFFAEVEAHRYASEPAIPEMADFARWSGRDVLEAGCGIGTDGLQFARAGANYVGMDFSPTAVDLARRRFADAGARGEFLHGSIVELPFPDESFDLVYSNGVVHHLPTPRAVIDEFHRVLRPGGQATVMVYHRHSLNFFVSLMVLRRTLAAFLLVPGMDTAVAKLTGESLDVMQGHKTLLRTHGLRYLSDPSLFLSNNTDGPGNPLSRVYSRRSGAALFSEFASVDVAVRFLNLRVYPGGDRIARTAAARRLERRWGWHLWIRARRAGSGSA
ncbi:MAG: hypothetical protein QOI80_1233 [Solirubrobacteraceae bacterium]|nr:hypothetical protein [Solirubrobacteraceae bacterium]